MSRRRAAGLRWPGGRACAVGERRRWRRRGRGGKALQGFQTAAVGEDGGGVLEKEMGRSREVRPERLRVVFPKVPVSGEAKEAGGRLLPKFFKLYR